MDSFHILTVNLYMTCHCTVWTLSIARLLMCAGSLCYVHELYGGSRSTVEDSLGNKHGTGVLLMTGCHPHDNYCPHSHQALTRGGVYAVSLFVACSMDRR